MAIAQIQDIEGEPRPVRLPTTMSVMVDGQLLTYSEVLLMNEDTRNALGLYTIVPSTSVFGLKPIYTDLELIANQVIEIGHYPMLSPNTLKGIRLEQLAEIRKLKTQEVTFAGIPIVVDEKTENAVAKAGMALELCPPGTEIDFEVRRGVFVELDLTYIQALGMAAFLRVQACFSHVKAVTAQIMACETQEELEAIDIVNGWPG